jgi:general secretion pathway protein J
VSRLSPSEGGPAADGNARGFTLLELLVAITLLGLLMTGILGGVRLGARAWETGAVRLEDDARLLAVEQFLRSRLKGALPLYREDASGEIRLTFSGLADELAFVGTLPGPLAPGLHQFTLGLREDDEGVRHLSIAWQRLPAADAEGVDDQAGAGRRDLLANVEAVAFDYYGAPDRGQQAAWQEQWSSDDVLPTLVRLRIELPEGDRRWFPDLIVRPMIDQPPFVEF